MIIIVEGIDGSGKTSLARQLAIQNGYNIIRKSQPKTEEERKGMLGEYIQLIKSSKNVIFDRCWYSEMAYGPVMRNASAISYPDMYALERQVAKVGGLIIYCTGPEAGLWLRCQKRGEDYVTSRDAFKTIYNNFNDIMRSPHLVPVVRYEYKDV